MSNPPKPKKRSSDELRNIARQRAEDKARRPIETLKPGLMNDYDLPQVPGFVHVPEELWASTRHRLKCALKGLRRLKEQMPQASMTEWEKRRLEGLVRTAQDDTRRARNERDRLETLGPVKLQAAHKENTDLKMQIAALSQEGITQRTEIQTLKEQNMALIATLGRLSGLGSEFHGARRFDEPKRDEPMNLIHIFSRTLTPEEIMAKWDCSPRPEGVDHAR